MKKVVNYVLMILVALLFFNTKVLADTTSFTLVKNYIPNVFAVQKYKTGGSRIYYGQWYQITKNNVNKIGYCIEIGVGISENIYTATDDYLKVGLNAEEAKYIKMVAHYGWKYKNHDSYKYYLAAQELIWERLSLDEVYWTNSESIYGDVINVEQEKKEILDLVEKHYVTPEFNVIEINYGEELILEDKNNVLNDYEIVSITNANYEIIDNTIKLRALSLDDIKLELRRKNIENISEVFYYAGVSQKMVSDSGVDGVSKSYEFKNNGVKVIVQKRDLDTNETIKMAGIKFKLYDLTKEEYVCYNDACEFVTDEEGRIEFEYLSKGKYRLEEVDQVLDGYLWNKEELIIDVNIDNVNDDNILYVDFFNKSVDGTIIINKYGENLLLFDNNYSYDVTPLFGVYFEVTTFTDIIYKGKEYKANEVVVSAITDIYGNIVIDDLPLGKYKVKEVATLDDYILDNNEYLVDLRYQDQYTAVVSFTVNITNSIKKGTVEILKVDEEGNPLLGVTMGIYNNDDELIYMGVTNEDGKIVLNDLCFGEYYLKEIISIEGYTLNDEKIYFSVDKDDQVIRVKMINEKIIDVPDTYKDSNIINYNKVFLPVGIGWLYYFVKKGKKR